MQNSGRSQSLTAGRQGVPAGFSCMGDPLGEGRETMESLILLLREHQMDPPTGSSSHSVGGLEAKINRPLSSVPSPHQALCTAITVGALRPCTQGAVVGKAAGVWAPLE